MGIEKEKDISSKKEEKKENEIDSDDSDDAYLSVDSNNFNIDLENSKQNMQIISCLLQVLNLKRQ